MSSSPRGKDWIPQRGEAVWLTFDTQARHEQAGRRPAVVLSPREYNKRTGLAIFCPVTSQVKGYPFEVALPPGLEIEGVALADQVRNLDWHARKAKRIATLPAETMNEILGKLETLIKR